MDGRQKPVTPETVLDDEAKPTVEFIEYKTRRYPLGIFASTKTRLDALSDKLRPPFDAAIDKLREPIDKIQIAKLKKHHKLKEESSGPPTPKK